MSVELPDPIARYMDASARLDPDGIVAAFAADAVVRDEGQTHRGAVAIRAWAASTTATYGPVPTPLSIAGDDGRYTVRARVVGAFPGSPVTLAFAFTVADDRIARLEVAV